MNVELLELAAASLGELVAEVVFVGGATVELWITDPGAPPMSPTTDVDVIVEVATRAAFYDFEGKLRARGFAEDREDGLICRWRHTTSGLILDAMPARGAILGFENRWQAEALPHAIERELPSGNTIRAVSPPYLIATKLEAFRGRGRGDFLGSRDFSDVVALLDGRVELGGEVAARASDIPQAISRTRPPTLDAPRLLHGPRRNDASRRSKPTAHRRRHPASPAHDRRPGAAHMIGPIRLTPGKRDDVV